MLKPREERRRVLVRARMRVGGAWHDACIVNVASRGLGLQAARPPQRGDYVEICRGVHVVIGQVVWRSDRRFGVRTQGTIPIYSLINEPDRSALPAESAPAHVLPRERRRASRSSFAAESSGHRGRAMQFATIALGAACVALSLGAVARDALARPLAAVNSALARR
ncbi:hypothetical protein G7078_10145 [Sphingomonas sinipercae]|uniref:PilZ domain-containing protein n=1 Tax=Sphingomonas sinipercae TaxID=2714944 RepID=A0A6G7ZQA7_9SPHN|nr:hypothetical protein [Sphingomonas sinipercae]QIL03102.1 hypothetical protein G7078_10145 [Sphingomonas sinipercae]